MKKKLFGSFIAASILVTCISADTITKQEKISAKSNYVLPSPDSLFSAFNKIKPNIKWHKYISNSSEIAYSSDPQIAYNLGIQISDAYLLFNEGKLSSRNITMMELLSTKLGVKSTIVKRIRTIKNALISKDSKTVKQELTYMHEDIKKELNSNRRVDLASVVSAGSWIGAMSAITSVLKDNYTKEAASFLAQKDVIVALYKSLENKQSLMFDETTQEVISSLKQVEQIIGSKKTLSKDDINKVHHIMSTLLKKIEKV